MAARACYTVFMRSHLYEFRSDKKRLSCLCGWERTLKTADPKLVLETFTAHCLAAAPKP